LKAAFSVLALLAGRHKELSIFHPVKNAAAKLAVSHLLESACHRLGTHRPLALSLICLALSLICLAAGNLRLISPGQQFHFSTLKHFSFESITEHNATHYIF